MKKVLVIALLASTLLVNCFAFAVKSADTAASDSVNTEQSVQVEKPQKQDRHNRGEREPKPNDMPAPEEAPEKPAPEEAPEKPEKPEAPEKNETEEDTSDDVTNGDADESVSDDAVDEDTSDDAAEKPEKPEHGKKPIDKKCFHEKKDELKKDKKPHKEYMQEIKGLFKDCDDEARDELLDEIAASKKEENDDSVDTFIDGEAVDFDKYDGIKPIIENGRALVPVRAVTEAYGATVEWDEETKNITITKDETVIVLQIGSLTATVNGEDKELDVAPVIHKGRTLVPIRFVAEAFELSVDWDNDSRTIVVE